MSETIEIPKWTLLALLAMGTAFPYLLLHWWLKTAEPAVMRWAKRRFKGGAS